MPWKECSSMSQRREFITLATKPEAGCHASGTTSVPEACLMCSLKHIATTPPRTSPTGWQNVAGDSLRARTPEMRRNEQLLRVVTHNIMLALRQN
jgi:hypothetical protein